MAAEPGAPSFIELGVPAGSRACRFYQTLFGWSVREMGDDNFLLETPSIQIGLHARDETAVFVVYFQVADIDEAAGRVRAAGGTVGPITDEKSFGRFAECRDDQGVRFGLRQLPPP